MEYIRNAKTEGGKNVRYEVNTNINDRRTKTDKAKENFKQK